MTYTLNDCIQGLINHRTREAYAIIGQGLWLLNALSLHALPVGERNQGRKSVATVATDFPPPENEGFIQWLRENVAGPESPLRLSQRTCYRYMAAARHMGLKAGDGEAELAALEARDALGGRRISDLYKQPALADAPAPPKTPAPPPEGPEQMWLPFTTELYTLLEPESKSRLALYKMPAADLDAMEAHLRFGLDAIREVKSTRKAGKPAA